MRLHEARQVPEGLRREVELVGRGLLIPLTLLLGLGLVLVGECDLVLLLRDLLGLLELSIAEQRLLMVGLQVLQTNLIILVLLNHGLIQRRPDLIDSGDVDRELRCSERLVGLKLRGCVSGHALGVLLALLLDARIPVIESVAAVLIEDLIERGQEVVCRFLGRGLGTVGHAREELYASVIVEVGHVADMPKCFAYLLSCENCVIL